MKYKLLGKSGLKVSELALGAMTFATEERGGPGKEESRKVYNAFREAGGNFIDAANIYADGMSEEYLGEFIQEERERIVLASKYNHPFPSCDINSYGSSRKNMMESVNASLKRLNTGYIDLYWVHYWDFLTPTEEVMRGLDDLITQGKVLYVGVSDTPAWVVSQANMLADLKGWSQFVGLQTPYSLIDRTAERELLPMSRALDLAVIPWGVLGSGILSGKYNKNPKSAGRFTNPLAGTIDKRSFAIAQEVIDVANEIDATPSQVAIAWLLKGPANIVPLIGAKTVSQWEVNSGCLDIELSNDHMVRLNKISAIEMGFTTDCMQTAQRANADRGVIDHRSWRSGGYLPDTSRQ